MLGEGVPTLDIVIVNWNTGERLQTCIASIARADQEGFRLRRVVVVDNGSTDRSVEGLLESNPRVPLCLLRNAHNAGFARAANQGARAGDGNIILFLNPDTRLFRDSLRTAVSALAAPDRGGIGAIGIQLMDENHVVSRSCARRPTPARLWAMVFGLHNLLPSYGLGLLMTDWDHAASRDVDHVIGAYYLILRSVFEQIGGFDERFFVYYEDLDLSVRVTKHGYKIRYIAEARAMHEGGGSSRAVPAFRLFLSLQSRSRLAFKLFSRPTAIALLIGTLTVECGLRLLAALIRGRRSDIAATLAASRRLWAAAPALIAEERRGAR